jgi:hypothetical protein
MGIFRHVSCANPSDFLAAAAKPIDFFATMPENRRIVWFLKIRRPAKRQRPHPNRKRPARVVVFLLFGCEGGSQEARPRHQELASGNPSRLFVAWADSRLKSWK